jgi:hypothetical protein
VAKRKRRSKKLLEADIFRARVQQLRNLAESDWSDWEADWLDEESTRPDDYVYSDKERVILNQLIASATPFEGYNGWSVPDLLKIANRYRPDLDENNEEFVAQLWKRQPRALWVRTLNQLAKLARFSEPIGWDEQVQAVLRETRARDDELHREVPPWVAYPEPRVAWRP